MEMGGYTRSVAAKAAVVLGSFAFGWLCRHLHATNQCARGDSTCTKRGADTRGAPTLQPRDDCGGQRDTRTESLFLVVERFRDGDPRPVYARFRAQGRLAPPGLRYVSSWVTQDLSTCYQVMAGSRGLVSQWTARWEDLTQFEVIPVLTSPEAAARVAALR